MLHRCNTRLISLLLACMIILSLLSGCGSISDNSSLPTSDPLDAPQDTPASEEKKPAAASSEEEQPRNDEVENAVKADDPITQPKADEDKVKEEEARQKAEEEKAKAEEEARKKAEEERAKAEEEARIKAEQLNSYSMMYYLAITAEEIRSSKDNRIVLEDIYSSLINELNPDAIDDITKDHLKTLRKIIEDYMLISTKRERLQFIYNQEKAAAMRSAIPNPLSILSVASSLDWKRLAASVVYSAVDSLSRYKSASEKAGTNYLTSGWELDDQELETIHKNRERAFDYMVDMVQKYHLDGLQTLNEKAIEKFAEICNIESIPERISRLEAEEKTYQLLGNYWLELASCYFETDKYEKCLDCVARYQELAIGIYRLDSNYASILPKAITAAQMTYKGDEYNSYVKAFADDLEKNTENEEWASRYYLAQVYLDLYARTNDQSFLEKAYGIIHTNVTVLLKEQRSLNQAFLDDVQELTIEEPDYRFMSEQEKKEKEKWYKEEKNRVKAYNKEQKEARKTELPSLYEPLVLNCELLFALADNMNISNDEKKDIEAILGTDSNGIFMVKPINDAFSFFHRDQRYAIEFSGDTFVIPADLLTSGSIVTVSVFEGDNSTVFDDCVIAKVERKGSTADTFAAHFSSKQLKKYDWTADSKIVVTITYDDAYGKTAEFDFAVSEFKERWYGNKVVFTQT